jgi:hypothetical protein
MARCSVLERKEPTQQFKLLLPVKRDGRPPIRAGNHRTQDKQKNRVQWVGDLRLLARVIHTREVLQKVGRAVLFSNAGHAKFPKSGSLTTVDLEKSQLVSNLFNRLPCHRTTVF